MVDIASLQERIQAFSEYEGGLEFLGGQITGLFTGSSPLGPILENMPETPEGAEAQDPNAVDPVDAFFTKLDELAQADEQLFSKLDTIFSEPGFKEFVENLTNHEGLNNTFNEILASSSEESMSTENSLAVINVLATQSQEGDEFFNTLTNWLQDESKQGMIQDFATGLAEDPQQAIEQITQAIEISNRFGEYPGAENFLTKLAGDDALSGAFATLGGESYDQDAFLNKLEGLAEQDPQIFNKLDNITSEPGFERFVGNISEHEGLRSVFGDVFTGEGVPNEDSLDIINSIYAETSQNDDFFNSLNEFVENPDNQGMIDTFVNDLLSDPEGNMFDKLKGFIENKDMMEMFSGLQDFLGNMDFDMENIAQIMLALVNGCYAMVEGLADMSIKAFEQGPAVATSNDNGMANDNTLGQDGQPIPTEEQQPTAPGTNEQLQNLSRVYDPANPG